MQMIFKLKCIVEYFRTDPSIATVDISCLDNVRKQKENLLSSKAYIFKLNLSTKVLVYPSDSFLISNVIIVTTFNLLISGEKIVHYTSNM